MTNIHVSMVDSEGKRTPPPGKRGLTTPTIKESKMAKAQHTRSAPATHAEKQRHDREVA